MSKFSNAKRAPRVHAGLAVLAAAVLGMSAAVAPRADALPGNGRAEVVEDLVMRRRRKRSKYGALKQTAEDRERAHDALHGYFTRRSSRLTHRQLRRQLGITSGRQWVRFRKELQRAEVFVARNAHRVSRPVKGKAAA